MRRVTFPVLLLLALAACTPSLEKPRPTDPLIGCWYGEDFQPVFQRKTAWLMQRRADGTFTVEFKPLPTGDSAPQLEEGLWSHKNGSYVTVTTKVAGRSVDTSKAEYTDTYQVESLQRGVLTYRHQKLNATFTSKQVQCPKGNESDA